MSPCREEESCKDKGCGLSDRGGRDGGRAGVVSCQMRRSTIPRAVRAKAAVGRHRAVFMCQDCCATNVHIQLKGNVFLV